MSVGGIRRGARMTKRLAIIPARGGSKRIAGKNIRDFCGKPMVGHILATASDSGLFDEIHVSTDDHEIIDVVTALGFTPAFVRPESLAGDVTPLMSVVKWVYEQYASKGDNFDEVWLLMACAPLIESADLLAAASLFDENGGAHPVMAVTKYQVLIEWAFRRLANGELQPVQEGMFAVRSQDIEEKYYDAGAFVIYPIDRVSESKGAGKDTGYIGYVLPKEKAVDIDDEDDWKLAEALFHASRQSN